MGRQGRILVVDDLENWRKQLVEMLQNAGYYADAASSVAEATDLLRMHLYHALVLDLRLNKNDPRNQEGIDLLRSLEEQGLTEAIKIIIISAYSNKERTRKVFKEFGVVDVLFKDHFSKQVLLNTVQQVFSTINLGLEILWQQMDGTMQAVLNLEINGNPVKADPDLRQRLTEELEDLLCRLFYRAKKVLVRPLTPGYSGMRVLRVQPGYPGGNGHDVVVKFGNAPAIKKEYGNFMEHVQPFLGGGRNTIALDFRCTPYLGGIIYSLLGTVNDQLVDFGDFYLKSDESRIKSSLDGLFRDTCGVWYANCGNLEILNLTEEYQRSLEYTPSMLDQTVFDQLAVQGKQQLSFVHLRSKKTFTDPREVLAGQPFIYSTYECITHGDFNLRNLLIDGDGHVWMIDFQETAHGHILRDVARLDSVIRFQLLRPEEATLKERLQLEEALCSIERFSQVEQLEISFSTTNRALAKAYAVVVHLRRLAGTLRHQTPNDDMSEYYVALLYHTLNTLRFPQLPVDQREHALLSACLLAERLK